MKIVKRKKINLPKLMRMLCISLILLSLMTVAVKTSASGSTANGYLEITVCRDDTLWDIAGQYNGDRNIQEFIYEIMELNNLENAGIFPGQTLKIPINN